MIRTLNLRKQSVACVIKKFSQPQRFYSSFTPEFSQLKKRIDDLEFKLETVKTQSRNIQNRTIIMIKSAQS